MYSSKSLRNHFQILCKLGFLSRGLNSCMRSRTFWRKILVAVCLLFVFFNFLIVLMIVSESPVPSSRFTSPRIDGNAEAERTFMGDFLCLRELIGETDRLRVLEVCDLFRLLRSVVPSCVLVYSVRSLCKSSISYVKTDISLSFAFSFEYRDSFSLNTSYLHFSITSIRSCMTAISVSASLYFYSISECDSDWLFPMLLLPCFSISHIFSFCFSITCRIWRFLLWHSSSFWCSSDYSLLISLSSSSFWAIRSSRIATFSRSYVYKGSSHCGLLNRLLDAGSRLGELDIVAACPLFEIDSDPNFTYYCDLVLAISKSIKLSRESLFADPI